LARRKEPFLFQKGDVMMVEKYKKRMLLVLGLLAVGLCAVRVLAYSYTWTGNTSEYWADTDNWTRAGCGSPCNEYPDGTDDDATVSTGVSYYPSTQTIDDLTVSDADVRLGRTGSGWCIDVAVFTFDSITVTASAGHTAQLRGGWCDDVYTY
jgi:hypothetical protein